MEERTMNKIPMKEIWEKLKAPFPQGEIKKHPSTGRAYIPVESIEKRLNETVGMGNWDFLVDPPQICRFGESGRESCIVSGCGYCRDVGDYVGNPGGGTSKVNPSGQTPKASVGGGEGGSKTGADRAAQYSGSWQSGSVKDAINRCLTYDK